MRNCMKYTTSVKRLAAFFITAALFTVMAGCESQPAGAETEPSPTQSAVVSSVVTPAPETPAPKLGLEAVFGKAEIKVAVISNSDEADSKLFFEGAQDEAAELGVKLELTAAKGALDSAVSNAAGSADAVIACLMSGAEGYGAISSAGIPACVFEMSKGSAPEGVSYIYYSPGNEAELAMDAALTYPPHDTPVRLILMFESKDSKSYKEYQKLKNEGKIFAKEVYAGSDEKPGAWLKSKLGRYVEGMLDAVYAENVSLAITALDTLEALKRDDMEVFCPGFTYETAARMAKNPSVFAQSVGANTYLAGRLSVRAALKALKGEGTVTLGLEPVLINAAELKDGNAALLDIGGNGGLYNEPWMEELRAHYATQQ